MGLTTIGIVAGINPRFLPYRKLLHLEWGRHSGSVYIVGSNPMYLAKVQVMFLMVYTVPVIENKKPIYLPEESQ